MHFDSSGEAGSESRGLRGFMPIVLCDDACQPPNPSPAQAHVALRALSELTASGRRLSPFWFRAISESPSEFIWLEIALVSQIKFTKLQ